MTKEELLQTYFYIEDISGSTNTVYVTKYETSAPSITLSYSYDCSSWYSFTFSTSGYGISLPANSRVYLKGNNGYFSTTKYNYINCANNFKAGGNIMSLISGDNFKTSKTITNSYALAGVFYHGTRLIDASELILPATNLSNNCYQSFFAYCSNLTTPPKILDCTTLSSECYRYMFGACSSLTTAPELPATNLVYGCYYDMFRGCSKLNYIKADFIDYNSNNTYNWVSGVSSTGTFVMNPEATYNPDNIRGISGIPTGWNVENSIVEIPDYFYIEDISGSTNTVSITKNNTSAPTLNIEYSTDGVTWTTKTMNSSTTANTFTIPANGKLYLRGVNNQWGSISTYAYYNTITASSSHNVGGNIMSLLYGINFEGKTSFPTTNEEVFYSLFRENTTLVNAQDLQLPATTLANWCYSDMFSGCSSLTTAPELPATKLANNCYYGMFFGTNLLPDCSNIDFTSETVVKSGGLRGLFAGTKVTDKDLMEILPINPETGHYYLPATTLVVSCYSDMFYGCSSLTTAPELPATTLADYCYSAMFYGCSSLTTAPDLPATTLNNGCYTQMFQNCTSLTTAPELPATTLGNSCYYQMFRGCSKLNYVCALFTDIPNTNSSTDKWLDGVSETGTFIKNVNATWDTETYRGVSGVPTGWNVYTSNQYVINISSNNTNYGTISGSTSGIYNLGDTVTFTAIPAEKCEFIKWSDGSTELTRTIEITEDTPYVNEYTAIFKLTSNIYFINQSENINILKIIKSNKKLQYKIGNGDWVEITEKIKTIEFEDIVYIKGNNTSLNGVKFNNSEYTSVGGKLSALLYGEDVDFMGNIIPEDSINTFKGLFKNNTNLVDISGLELPENTTKGCYSYMFQGCTNLGVNYTSTDNTILTLPATELAPQCYQHMFTGCKSLKSIPELPANDLTSKCYHGMFMDCDSIDTVSLSAEYLAPYAYSNIFLGSDNLNEVTTEFIEFDKYSLKGWLKDVKNEGTLHLSKEYPYDIEETKNILYLPKNWNIEINRNINYFYVEDISGSENTVIIKKTNTSAPTLNLEYSYNQFEWTIKTMNSDTTANTFTVPANSKIYFRGVNNRWATEATTSNWSNTYNFITCTKEYEVGGNIMSLLYGENYQDKTVFEYNAVFESLFSVYGNNSNNSQNLIYSDKLILPALKLTKNAYTSMFKNCSKLRTTPILPATELSYQCYDAMFQSCISITITPKLPALTSSDRSYAGMFAYCNNLIETQLISTRNVGYQNFESMFLGCSKLNYIKTDFIEYTNVNNVFQNWVQNVSSTGTFLLPVGSTFADNAPRNGSGIPLGWEIQYFNPDTDEIIN